MILQWISANIHVGILGNCAEVVNKTLPYATEIRGFSPYQDHWNWKLHRSRFIQQEFIIPAECIKLFQIKILLNRSKLILIFDMSSLYKFFECSVQYKTLMPRSLRGKITILKISRFPWWFLPFLTILC